MPALPLPCALLQEGDGSTIEREPGPGRWGIKCTNSPRPRSPPGSTNLLHAVFRSSATLGTWVPDPLQAPCWARQWASLPCHRHRVPSLRAGKSVSWHEASIFGGRTDTSTLRRRAYFRKDQIEITRDPPQKDPEGGLWCLHVCSCVRGWSGLTDDHRAWPLAALWGGVVLLQHPCQCLLWHRRSVSPCWDIEGCTHRGLALY